MSSPITDLSRIDTTPGSGHRFSPPAGFAGGEKEYGEWLKLSSFDMSFRQHLFVASRMMHGANFTSVRVDGPYAEKLRRSIRSLHERCRNAAPVPKYRG